MSDTDRILNSVPAAIYRTGRDRRIRFVNQSFADFVRRPAEELLGSTIGEVTGLSEVEEYHWGFARRVFETGRPVEYETESKVVGPGRWFLCQMLPEFDAAGGVEFVLCVNTEITALKRTEAELRRSESRLRAFLDHTPAMAWIKEADGRYQYVNRAMAERFGGAERWLGRTDAEVLPPAVAATVVEHDRQVRETGRSMQVEEAKALPDGIAVPLLVNKFPIPHQDGTVSSAGIAVDLGDLRRQQEEKLAMERRMFESVKLESLGMLASGIAHDFNNLLTVVLGYCSLAQMELAAGRPVGVPEHLRQVETAASRAADLCRQMLAYAGKGQFHVGQVSLTHLIEEIAQLLQASISKKAVLRHIMTANLPPVECDATQIRQVVMNLITNASDAIGDRSGVITVSTGVIDADAKYLADIGADDLPPARYVYAEVSDTGCGMDAATTAKIFEPFYTTKITGRGLGLSAVQGIIRAHKGAIKVYSSPGRGTTFKVLLPAGATPLAAEASAVPPQLHGRGRTVLVVDDEEDIRVFTRKVLEHGGFRVLLAADGLDAVRVFGERAAEVAVVVCDLTMPHQDGAVTFRQMRKLSPTAKVILTSGFSEDEATAGLGGKGLAGFLRKPYRAQELLQTVAAVADAPAP